MELIILPGLLSDARLFDAQLRAFDAIVIDDFYAMADRIEAMARHALDRMPARSAVLGHSMGGRVALEMWRLAPQRIDRLAIANTGVHPVRDGEAAARHRLLDLGRTQGDAALVDAWLPPMLGPDARSDAALYAQLHAMAVAGGTETYAAQIRALLGRPDAQTVLPTITCPFQVIAAREDSWSPVEQHEAIAAAAPGATLSIVENAGHMAPAERPEAFNEIIRAWLARGTSQDVHATKERIPG